MSSNQKKHQSSEEKACKHLTELLDLLYANDGQLISENGDGLTQLMYVCGPCGRDFILAKD